MIIALLLMFIAPPLGYAIVIAWGCGLGWLICKASDAIDLLLDHPRRQGVKPR